MKKTFTLLFVTILAITSLTTYIILTEKIIAGNLKIIDGQKQLEEGERMLAQGKIKLANGQRKLSEVKEANKGMRFLPLVSMAILPISAGAFVVTNNKIIAGNQQVALGEEKIKLGEKQLETGKLELHSAMNRLMLANRIRIACAIATIFLTGLLVILLFCWRRR